MPRHIFIGDIHGCHAEVLDLLARIGVSDADRVVALGDLTRKGPDAARCIDLWQERRYDAVLGNNDAKLLARARNPLRRWLSRPADARVLRNARRLQFVSELPLYLEFPEIGVVAVHGGILPNARKFSAALVTRRAALELRHVRRDDAEGWSFVPKGEERPGEPFWADVWEGDRIVVYGHTPRREPKVHPRAIGLDTGCVYGTSLTAAVFDGPERWRLVSVPARREYAR